MNKARRQIIAAAAYDLAQAIGILEDVKARLEDARDEEQEYFDNLPENWQDGDKGQAAQEAIEHLETVIDALSEVTDGSLDGDLEDAQA